MAEDISVQILTQTSSNIQKLFDLSTRIDERVKAIKEQQEALDDRITDILKEHNAINRKIAVLESHGSDVGPIMAKIADLEKQLTTIDKRLTAVEGIAGSHQDRWKHIASFVVQLVWIVLAAWILFKLNLQPPAVP